MQQVDPEVILVHYIETNCNHCLAQALASMLLVLFLLKIWANKANHILNKKSKFFLSLYLFISNVVSNFLQQNLSQTSQSAQC